MGWIGCNRYENFRRDFVERTFALVRHVLHRVSGDNQMVPNAPKQYETHQNVSLLSNGVDRVCSLRKILTRLRGTNFCTSSARFALSFIRKPNGPESTKIVQNAPKRQFRVQWGGSDAFVAKNFDATSWHELLHLFSPFCIEFQKATKQSRMLQNSTNAPNVSLGSDGVNRMLSLRKIPT